MIRNILLKIQYDGTKYSGWQRQGNTSNTIETKISSCLGIFLGLNEVEIHGSGRTDAGVHAKGQYASFKVDSDVSVDNVVEYLNKYLPEDIKIVSGIEVPERFHARLSAKSKKYVYTIDNNAKADVFLRKYAWGINEKKLDIDKMIETTKALVGEHDFITFSDMKSNKKSTVRFIEAINIFEIDGIIKIEFIGNGFLYHMVRKLTAALVLSGEGRISAKDIEKLLDEKNRQAFKELAPSKGLCLEDVYYEL